MLEFLDRFLRVSLYLLTVILRLFCYLGTLGYGLYLVFNFFQTHQVSISDISYFLLCVFVVSLSEFLTKKI